MVPPRYHFRFQKITDGWIPVTFTPEHARHPLEFVAALKDAQFGPLPYDQLSATVADMVDLALAVYVADRCATRRSRVPCHISIELPLRAASHYQQPQVYECLTHLLYYMTQDHWEFHFLARTGSGRGIEQQPKLFASGRPAAAVALWSGGLDALAGVYLSYLAAPDHLPLTLFSTGDNPLMRGAQTRVYRHVRRHLSLTSSIPLNEPPLRLVQVPLRVRHWSHTPNHLARTRGFVFLLLGAACALLEGKNVLTIYENGIGAINLPYRASEVGLDHSRSVHPRTLRLMGHLITQITGTPFTCVNPFEWQTKAQMCAPLVSDGLAPIIGLSVTCDHLRRDIPSQCGYCTSCLLRRQALLACGLEEPPERYLATARPTVIDPYRDGIPLQAMLSQVRTLEPILAQPDPWPALVQAFLDLGSLADEVAAEDGVPLVQIRRHLIDLYTRYCREWPDVLPILGHELLPHPTSPSAITLGGQS